MTITVITPEQLVRRFTSGSGICALDTPTQRLIRALDDVAQTANDLGKKGHGVKRVELIETRGGRFLDELEYEIRVVPDYRLKT